MERRHPEAFNRLAVLHGATIIIEPVDLPFALAMVFNDGGHDLRVADDDDRAQAVATVRGPLLVLTDLLEGRIDGDAMFFSRELTIEGDTEAVLVLRNALDGAGVDITADLTAALGPLARPATVLAGGARRLFGRLAGDLDVLHGAMVGPLTRRSTGQAATIKRLEARVTELESRVRRAKRVAPPMTRKATVRDD
jgi:O2-independent ubiquinone biosynthesis accessory factor UbiT